MHLGAHRARMLYASQLVSLCGDILPTADLALLLQAFLPP